jgi:rubrerythrin
MKNLKSYNEMMSNIPNLRTATDQEILRVGIIAELDAINLYEQMAKNAKNPIVKKVLLEIAKEEKTHVGEFEALLLELDNEQEKELKMGKKEVDDISEE